VLFLSRQRGFCGLYRCAVPPGAIALPLPATGAREHPLDQRDAILAPKNACRKCRNAGLLDEEWQRKWSGLDIDGRTASDAVRGDVSRDFSEFLGAVCVFGDWHAPGDIRASRVKRKVLPGLAKVASNLSCGTAASFCQRADWPLLMPRSARLLVDWSSRATGPVY